MFYDESIFHYASVEEALNLTQNEEAILRYLENKDNYGAKIAEAFLISSDGIKFLSNGTLYPILKKLTKKKFLESYEDDSNISRVRKGKRKVMYTITLKGRSALIVLDDFAQKMKNCE